MPEALVIENKPEIAEFAVAAFKRVGVEAFSVKLSANGARIMEISGNVAIVLLNMNGDGADHELPGLIAERWPDALLIILTARLSGIRDLPASFVLIKPAPLKTLISIINRAALAVALAAKAPKQRSFEGMSICLDADVANDGKRPI